MKNFHFPKLSFFALSRGKRRISKAKILFICLFTFTVYSCKQNDFLDNDVKKESSALRKDLDVDKLFNTRSNLQRGFGKSLAKSLSESQMLREIIKKKALEMFNDDYEILYEMIRDERVENNLTVDELITKNLGDKQLMKKLESEYPTLTILVPNLPQESFNANRWNTSTEIPKVAIRLSKTNDVPIINSDGSENILEGQYTPAFPVLVVKENERVVSDKSKDFKNLKTKSFISKHGVTYKFLSDEFDRKLKKGRRVGFNMDPKLYNAYTTYQNADGWQRDFIYYNLTPNQVKGPFSNDFKDGLTIFRMVGDPFAAYQKLADQAGDPYVYGMTNGPQWSGGYFEFKVISLVNGKNGVGSELVTYFGANPSELFELTYEKRGSWFSPVYFLTGISLKSKDLSIPIINWDLNQYSTTIKVSIEEVDLLTTTVSTEVSSVKFANNFGIENGVLQKIGLKLGASLELTQTQTSQRTSTQGNDLLGDVTVNFGDDVIVGTIPLLGIPLTREYNTGWYSIGFEPIRVQ